MKLFSKWVYFFKILAPNGKWIYYLITIQKNVRKNLVNAPFLEIFYGAQTMNTYPIEKR